MKKKLIFSLLWLATCLALASWWVILAYRLVRERHLMPEAEVLRLENMLMWEGLSWFILLIAGGSTLTFLIVREHRQRSEIQNFVAAFSHDLKTSLSSLRLLAESLHEEARETRVQELSSRLLADSIRLQIQLENSLYLANFSRLKLFLEDIPLGRLVTNIGHHWPQLRLKLEGDARLVVDARAIECILRNIVHNAVFHGAADLVEFRVTDNVDNEVSFEIHNNGRAFSGDIHKAGKMFYRQNSSSGSGLGLYISRELVKKMGGVIEFLIGEQGRFFVRLQLAGERL